MREFRGFWVMYMIVALFLTIFKDVKDFRGMLVVLIYSLSLSMWIMAFLAIRERSK